MAHIDAVENAYADLGSLAGGLAIITGGASGIGYALAQAAIGHGLHVAILDIEAMAIEQAVVELQAEAGSNGVDVFGCEADVSDPASVAAAREQIGAHSPDRSISLLCCNAGVGGGGPVLTAREVDWDFVLGVNVKGVANVVREFVPGMLTQDGPGSVVTTASQDGLCAAQGVYGVSKHACVALTEALHGEVANRLSVHVLCPNVVATNIVTSERNRPERFGGPVEPGPATAVRDRIAERFRSMGMPPSRCAQMVFEAIRSGVFYILAEAEEDPGYVHLEAATRMRAILEGTRPYRPRSEFIASVFNLND